VKRPFVCGAPQDPISRQMHPISSANGSVASCDAAPMDDPDALAQLLADILDVFPPGPQRDVWLAWLEQLAADCRPQQLH
jgi:hypothetical protein